MNNENLKRIEKIKALAKERDQLILDEKEIINDLLYNIKIAITQLLFDRADDVLLMRHVLRREGFLPLTSNGFKFDATSEKIGFHPWEPAIGINGNGTRRGIYFLLTRNGDGEPDIEFTEKIGSRFDRSTDRVEMYKECQETKEILYRFIGMFDEFEKEFYSYIDNELK